MHSSFEVSTLGRKPTFAKPDAGTPQGFCPTGSWTFASVMRVGSCRLAHCATPDHAIGGLIIQDRFTDAFVLAHAFAIRPYDRTAQKSALDLLQERLHPDPRELGGHPHFRGQTQL